MKRLPILLVCLALALAGCGSTKKDEAAFEQWLTHQHYGTASHATGETDSLFGLPKDVRATLQVPPPLTPDALRTIGADLARQSAKYPWILAVSDGSRTADVTTSSRDNDQVLTDVAAVQKIPGVQGFRIVAPDNTYPGPMALTTDRSHLTSVARAAHAANLTGDTTKSRTVTVSDGANTVDISGRSHENIEAMLRTIEALLPYVTVTARDWDQPVVHATAGSDASFADALAALPSPGSPATSFELVRGRLIAVRSVPREEATIALRIAAVDGVTQVRLDDPTLIQTERGGLNAVVSEAAALPGHVQVDVPRPAGTMTVTPTTPPVCSFSGTGAELRSLITQAAWCDRTEFDYVAISPTGFQFNPRAENDPAPAVAAIRAVPWQGSRAVSICVRAVCLDFESTATGRAQHPSVRPRFQQGATPSPGDDAVAQSFGAEWDRTATS